LGTHLGTPSSDSGVDRALSPADVDVIEVASKRVPDSVSQVVRNEVEDPTTKRVLEWKVQSNSELSDPSDITTTSFVSVPENDKRMKFTIGNETAPRSPPPHRIPTDTEIMMELRTLLQSIDMSKHSKKSVRHLLEDRFHCDLRSKRDFISQSVDKILLHK
jgi:hypothetical protein